MNIKGVFQEKYKRVFISLSLEFKIFLSYILILKYATVKEFYTVNAVKFLASSVEVHYQAGACATDALALQGTV